VAAAGGAFVRCWLMDGWETKDGLGADGSDQSNGRWEELLRSGGRAAFSDCRAKGPLEGYRGCHSHRVLGWEHGKGPGGGCSISQQPASSHQPGPVHATMTPQPLPPPPPPTTFSRRWHTLFTETTRLLLDTKKHGPGERSALCLPWLRAVILSPVRATAAARAGVERRTHRYCWLLSLPQAANAALTLVWSQMATLPVRRLVGGGSLGRVRELWNAEPRLPKTQDQDPLRPSTVTSFRHGRRSCSQVLSPLSRSPRKPSETRLQPSLKALPDCACVSPLHRPAGQSWAGPAVAPSCARSPCPAWRLSSPAPMSQACTVITASHLPVWPSASRKSLRLLLCHGQRRARCRKPQRQRFTVRRRQTRRRQCRACSQRGSRLGRGQLPACHHGLARFVARCVVSSDEQPTADASVIALSPIGQLVLPTLRRDFPTLPETPLQQEACDRGSRSKCPARPTLPETRAVATWPS
jgi:hypothetical protein